MTQEQINKLKKDAEGVQIGTYVAEGAMNIQTIEHVENLLPGSIEKLKSLVQDIENKVIEPEPESEKVEHTEPKAEAQTEKEDTLPKDWCIAGIKEMARAGHLKASYDWAAVNEIIKEKTPFKSQTPSELESMVNEAGIDIPEHLACVANNFRRIIIQGKFPEWSVKGYDASVRFAEIGSDFLKGYNRAKNNSIYQN